VEFITTNCGFLSLYQRELAEALSVPVVTSALMQATWIQDILPPGKRVGILTISADTLTSRHLDVARVPRGTPVWGVEDGCEFQRVILNDEPVMDVSRACQDVVDAATAFQQAYANLGAILFECTNMPPYRNHVKRATGLPVFSIETCLLWVVAAFRAGMIDSYGSVPLSHSTWLTDAASGKNPKEIPPHA